MEVCTAYFNDGSKYLFTVETREDLTRQAIEGKAKQDTLNKSGISELKVVHVDIEPERRYKTKLVAKERREKCEQLEGVV